MASIGERLKMLRRMLGNTQVEMARMMGSATNGQTWENYEAGRRRISIDHASALCRACRVSLDWIYHGGMDYLPADVRLSLQQLMKGADAPARQASGARFKSGKQ